MSAANDAVEKISGVIRSLMSLLTGDEEKQPEHDPPEWMTADDKERAARREAILRRRIARCSEITPTPKEPPSKKAL